MAGEASAPGPGPAPQVSASRTTLGRGPGQGGGARQAARGVSAGISTAGLRGTQLRPVGLGAESGSVSRVSEFPRADRCLFRTGPASQVLCSCGPCIPSPPAVTEQGARRWVSLCSGCVGPERSGLPRSSRGRWIPAHGARAPLSGLSFAPTPLGNHGARRRPATLEPAQSPQLSRKCPQGLHDQGSLERQARLWGPHKGLRSSRWALLPPSGRGLHCVASDPREVGPQVGPWTGSGLPSCHPIWGEASRAPPWGQEPPCVTRAVSSHSRIMGFVGES